MLRRPDGQRAQQEAVDDAEERGVDADAERQRQYGDAGESRRPPERSEGMTDVLPDAFKPRLPSLVANGVFDRFEAADRAPCRLERVFGRHSLAKMLLDEGIEITTQFVVQNDER